MSNSDPIVIVGATRTPMGGFQGDFSGAQATDLGAAAISGALAGAGLAAKPSKKCSWVVSCLPVRTSPGASGFNQGRSAPFSRRHHRQQNVRLGHEGHHAGA